MAQVFGYRIGVVGAIAMWGTDHRARPRRTIGVRLPGAASARVRPVHREGSGARSGDRRRGPTPQLTPLCDRHGRGKTGIDARAVQSELLNTYAVDLLPGPSIAWHKGTARCRRADAHERPRGAWCSPHRDPGAPFHDRLRSSCCGCSAGFLFFGAVVVGAVVNAVTHWGDPPTPEPSPSVPLCRPRRPLVQPVIACRRPEPDAAACRLRSR